MDKPTRLWVSLLVASAIVGSTYGYPLDNSTLPDSDHISQAFECTELVKDSADDIEHILYILHCDVKPLLMIYKNLVQKIDGKLVTVYKDYQDLAGVDKSDRSMFIWREFYSLEFMIENFYIEATTLMQRTEFCTYQTVKRFKQLKNIAMGSTLLSNVLDLMVIHYHKICLARVIENLPQVPYLIKDVVSIYIKGADRQVIDLNEPATPAPAEFSDQNYEGGFKFNLQEALERNGPIEQVIPLLLTVDSSQDNPVDTFRHACKEFLLKIEDRWQPLEMLGEMLSTSSNAIRALNDYVMRLVAPTKYADICSQLSF